MAEQERRCCIAFSPCESSTYGGGTIVVVISQDTDLPADCEVRLVFIGNADRHVVEARVVSQHTLQAVIPSHNTPECVELLVYVCVDGKFKQLGSGNQDFTYNHDSAHNILEYLVNTANDGHALVNADRRLNLGEEFLDTLDERIAQELKHIVLPRNWTIFGINFDRNTVVSEPRETVLHFCARYGLRKLATFLLNVEHSRKALTLRNGDGERPQDIARDCGFDNLAWLLKSHAPDNALKKSKQENTSNQQPRRHVGDNLVSLTAVSDNSRVKAENQYSRPGVNTNMEGEPPSSRVRLRQKKSSTSSKESVSSDKSINEIYETSGPKKRRAIHAGRYNHAPPDRHMSFPEQSTRRRTSPRLRRVSSPDPPYNTGTVKFSDHVRSISDSSSRDSDSDSDSDGDGSDLDPFVQVPIKHSYGIYQAEQRPNVLRRQRTEPIKSQYGRRKNIPSIELASPSGTRRILEESVDQVQDSLLRNHQSDSQDARKGRLCRFSSSCPSLAEQDTPPTSVLTHSPVIGGCHNSMLDIAQEETYSNDMRESHAYSSNDVFNTDNSTEHMLGGTNVKICINDVTVDSTEDTFPESAVSSQYEFDRKNKKSKRRRSWCPQNSKVSLSSANGQPRSPKQLAVMGRSMSLSSLDSNDESTSSSSSDDEEDDDDDQYHDAPESQPSHQSSQTPPSGRSYNRSQDSSLHSLSSPGSIGTPKANSTPSESDRGSNRSHNTRSSMNGSGRSLTDVRFDMDSVDQSESIQPSSAIPLSLMQNRSPSPDISQPGSKTNEMLALPQNLTKSVSTPSILTEKQPNQEEPDERQAYGINTTRPGRTKSAPGGGEINEKLENRGERETSSSERKTSPSRDIYKDLPNFDDDESTKKECKKERRRSSVFSLGQKFGSYRQKKIKEKENRRNTHQFVSVSFSNSTACDVCSKSMANKSALQCENCLVNVHESSCKDQIAPCNKFQHTHRHFHHHKSLRQSYMPLCKIPRHSTGSLPASVTGGLKSTQSMKEKKSSTAPLRHSIAYSSSSMITPTQRKESPPSSADRPGNGGSYGHFQWRRVATKLGIDKVINEENEESKDSSDGITSNITNSLSASVESLDDVGVEYVDFEDEDDLALNEPEPEAWSITVDKKTLKKMQPKDIKRQDHLWELVLTERHHFRTLKIMEKIFVRGMLREVQLSSDKIDRVFPKLDTLIKIHHTFLSLLEEQQNRKKDYSIDQIGDLLIEQFQAGNALQLVAAYGDFCSKHNDAVNYYKDLLKSDKKFQAFIRKCSISPVCKRQGIPECILSVSMRLTKYPLLLEPIIKTTRDKNERDKVVKALSLIKHVLADVNKEVEAYEKKQRLVEIYHKLDARSFGWFKKELKFKKSSVLSGNRKLIHEGVINWKTARGKLTEVIAVIITDVMFFLQENNQKYTFFSQDGKSAVIPLFRLLVREKGDTRDSKGIYVINQSRNCPEMYEIVCKSSEERRQWIEIMRKAIKNCPVEEEDTGPIQTEEEKKLLEAKAARLKDLLGYLHKQDIAIQHNCDQKFKYMLEILELSSVREIQTPPPVQAKSLKNLLEMTLVEATRLQLMVQSTGVNLNRSISSAGERESAHFQPVPLPKRAETFTAFDARTSAKGTYQSKLKAGMYQNVKDPAGRSASLQNLNRQESDSDLLLTVDTSKLWNMRRGSAGLPDKVDKHKDRNDRRMSAGTSFLQNLLKQPGEKEGIPDGGTVAESCPSADCSQSYREIAETFISFPLLDVEVEETLLRLVQYIHELMKRFAQYDTQVESDRVKLNQTTTQVESLSAENQKIMQEKKGQYKHNQQLEELRNLQETIRQERERWEKEKEKDQAKIDKQYMALEESRAELEKSKDELKAQQEELRRNKDVLQKQWDIFNQQETSHKSSSSSSSLIVATSPPVNHRRSASAEFSKTEEETLPHASKPEHSSSFRDPETQRPRSDIINPSRSDVPIHLLSATNQQRMRGIKQQLPLQLAGVKGHGGGSTSSSLTSLHQQIPNKLQSPTSSTTPHPPHHSSSSPNLISQIPSKLSLSSRSSPTGGGSARSSPNSTTVTPLGLPLKLAEGKSAGKVSSPTHKEKKKGSKHHEFYF